MAERGGGKEEEAEGVIDTWLVRHRPMWVGSTRHPFILSISNGTINFSAFKRWLGEDYIFVRTFVAFVGSVIVKAWKESDENSDVELILTGMAALKQELQWFRAEAHKWDLSLNLNLSQEEELLLLPQNQNQNHIYCRFLESLMNPDVEYTVAITAFWAIEAVYQESFSLCLEEGAKTPPELKDTCQRWGNEGFAKYCSSLKNIADRCLKRASEDVRKKAELFFLRVLQHEIEFWNMSCGDAPSKTLTEA